MKKIWITGAGGFLGRELTAVLSADPENEIFAMTGQTEDLGSVFADRDNVRVLGRDALFDAPASDTEGAYVISLAYPRGGRADELAPGMDYISRIFSEAEDRGAAGLINVSSQSVYSSLRTAPAAESDPVVIDSVYAALKYSSELMANEIGKRMPVTNIRLASLIGPGFDVRLVNKMIKFGIKDGVIKAAENGSGFGFLDVEDAARGIASLLSISPKKWRTVYNLGSGRSYTISEIARCVHSVLASRGIETELIFGEGEGRTDSSLDSTLLAEDTGFTAEIGLKESVEKIAEAELI